MKVYSTKENHSEQVFFLLTFVGDCLYLQLKRYGLWGKRCWKLTKKI